MYIHVCSWVQYMHRYYTSRRYSVYGTCMCHCATMVHLWHTWSSSDWFELWLLEAAVVISLSTWWSQHACTCVIIMTPASLECTCACWGSSFFSWGRRVVFGCSCFALPCLNDWPFVYACTGNPCTVPKHTYLMYMSCTCTCTCTCTLGHGSSKCQFLQCVYGLHW